MSRRVFVATCCVLLKPVEFVRELFPAYSPDVVVKVPPWRKKIFSVMYKTDDKSLNLYYCKYGDGKKWHIVERKILSFSGKKKKTVCGGKQRGAWGNAPTSGLIFLLFLPYHWLDQVWWMMEGGKRRVRGGQNLLAKLSEQNVRKTRACCVWAACCAGGGKGGCTWTEEEGEWSEEQQSRSKKDYRRFCCWLLLKMYVPLSTCSEDSPPV